ncbi:Purple acid phosphatase [Minicystis rosea]|nr:Purple acid phosphatase [Minicystis rosea]
MTRAFRIGIGAVSLLSAAIYAMACQDTSVTGGTGETSSSSSGGVGGSGGGGPISSFTPQGCSFSIAPRPEYSGFSLAKAENGATPNIRRVRLGLGGNVDIGSAGRADPSTTFAVAWQTDDGTFASDIQWGIGTDPTAWPAENRASGITWLTPEGGLNPQGDERMHEVYVCGLKAGTTYSYRVGGGPAGSEVWSDVYTFTTTPQPGPSTVKIGITGDSRGQQDDAWRILQKRMSTMGLALQLFSGDMINLAPDQGEWEKWLDSAWQDESKKPLTLGQLLTLAAHGNHDNHTALFYGNLVLPQDNAKFPKYGELFFSVDVGPVHVVVIDDAWVVSPTGDVDYKSIFKGWLEADLDAANKNRSTVPWILTMHHHPEYSSSLHGNDQDVLRGREFFGPIWDKYHVDVVLAGHDHNYERSKPLTGPTDTPTVHSNFADGTVYMVCAGAGADSYSAGNSTFTQSSHDYKSGGAIGLYGVLTADAKSLTIDAHELRVDGSDPVFDTFTITK